MIQEPIEEQHQPNPNPVINEFLNNLYFMELHKKIEDAECRYPQSADEILKYLCHDGIVNRVSVRVYVSIRDRFNYNFNRKLQSLMLEHKDAMMKKETEWLTKMENEKNELGKQIAIRDQMVLEARAETNEYKSMNQSILSQISDKEAKIAQVCLKCSGQSFQPRVLNYDPK